MEDCHGREPVDSEVRCPEGALRTEQRVWSETCQTRSGHARGGGDGGVARLVYLKRFGQCGSWAVGCRTWRSVSHDGSGGPEGIGVNRGFDPLPLPLLKVEPAVPRKNDRIQPRQIASTGDVPGSGSGGGKLLRKLG